MTAEFRLGLILDRIDGRIALDKQEGDIAYFHALALKFELVTKLVASAIVACIADDPDRHRYSLEHRLVRADSLGDWVDALNLALTGPASQCFVAGANALTRDLTERVSDADPRYEVVRRFAEAARVFGLDEQVGTKAALRQVFGIGAHIRNRTRGHGATTTAECTKVCAALDSALTRLCQIELFQLSWVYLHRNLSGKYRVGSLNGLGAEFDYLKTKRDVWLADGVHLFVERPIRLALVTSDADLTDVFVPNGNHRSGTFEALSYVTNGVRRVDSTPWSDPPGRLPRSETEGATALEQRGNVFTNLPPMPSGHVSRVALETRLQNELLGVDRHPIVTLTGPGGIGKTTLALAAIESLTRSASPPYEVVLWMSARDIELLDSGPKPVAPRVLKKQDIARAAVELLEPSDRAKGEFRAEAYFESCLKSGAAGSTLFVFDNFETLESPADVFSWLDTYIRPPNKILITTRFREFSGDYAIDIAGMTEDESLQLIERHAIRLNIDHLLTGAYREELIRESEGHPYVIKILLGQVAKEQHAVTPKRIVATSEHLLVALFERTFDKLSPGGQRVFLLLCSWRVFVPAVAVEAVSLRPGNERFDVAAALSELRRFSLIEEVGSDNDNEIFVGVPLAAAAYGLRKLEVSPFKVAVEEDRKLLMEFGAGKREDAHRGVLPRIERLVRAIAVKATPNPGSLDQFTPILEYLASRVPKAYLILADLVKEIDDSPAQVELAKTYIRRFLETASLEDRRDAWLRLADLCHTTDDAVGEVHALGEAAILPGVHSEEMGALANRINNKIYELRGRRVEDAWSPEVRLLIERVATAMERHIGNLNATDCSRLAWLYLNVGNDARARDIAATGLRRDSENDYCQKLVRRLGQ